MGSVIDYIECPNCGTEAHNDYYYKTGEEYTICNNCGYHHSISFKRNDEGQFITKDGTDNYEIDNLIMEEHKLENPYGSYRIKYYDSVGILCGALKSEEQFNTLLVNVKEQDNIELFTISRFVDGEIVVEHIIDNGPKFDGAGYSEEDREMNNNDLPF